MQSFLPALPFLLLLQLPTPAPAAADRLTVKEVTVFKDGHAFVLEEGRLPVGAGGNVVVDQLPAPVLGTFWPYSAEPGAKLGAVVAGREKTSGERDALNLKDLFEANTGAEVLVAESGASYLATIVKVPQPGKPAELKAAGPPLAAEARPPNADLVFLKTEGGVKAVPLAQLSQVTFLGQHRTTIKTEELVNRLTLKLDWEGAPKERAAVGMVYLQKGLRWIPEYKIVLDGRGKAAVRLQATLINELTDLADTAVHLVVGVPSISFKDTLDPMALRQTAAELSQYFREEAQTGYAFSNAIMTQARMGERRAERGTAPATEEDPALAQLTKEEDLFMFHLKNVTLRKGERMVVPVAEYSLDYREVFTLDLPFSPPRELRGNLNSEQERQLARLLGSPRVLRKVRLQNRSAYPITTAPALVFANENVLGQGMLTYAAINGSCDLPLTTAVDIAVHREERETGRRHEEIVWQNNKMVRVDLKGSLGLTNRLGRAVDLEVTRQILGTAGEAGAEGTAEQVNALEDGSWLDWEGQPSWWGWFSWPSWWARFNGVGRFRWTVHLEPGKRVDLPYAWHYYWN